jgi:histone H3/H4
MDELGPGSIEDDNEELYLPRTAVNKLIKEAVPNVRVSVDARELLLRCSTVFIHLIAQQATEISDRSLRKTISPEHIIEALEALGFGEYVDEVKQVLEDYKKQSAKKKKGSSRLDKLGIPEEELLRQQQELFAEAKQQQMESEQLEYQRLILQQLHTQTGPTNLPTQEDINIAMATVMGGEQKRPTQPELDEDYDA